MSDDWRFDGETGVDAGDYFLGQRKRLDIDKRRPVIRRASDIVGPGLGAAAVRVTNWNDTLATFNGYFSSLPGAANAPNAIENFTGSTIMDSEMGGTQTVTGMGSASEYKRIFLRNPGDASSVVFGQWLPSVASAGIVRLEASLQSIAAGWTAVGVANPQVRGTSVVHLGGGSIRATRSGWYDIGAQCSFGTGGAARCLMRIVTGANPDEGIHVMTEGTGAGGVATALNGSSTEYMAANTDIRLFVYATSAQTIDHIFLYMREV